MKRIIAILLFLLAAGTVIFLILFPKLKETGPDSKVNSFEECAAAGYPIMESYPRQCSSPGGRNFVESLIEERKP